MEVFTRDNFRCQYCGKSKKMNEINYDHVQPRCKGGKTVWNNIVTACYPCNTRKANRTPEQAGMRLLKLPYTPKVLPMTGPRIDHREIPANWLQYVVNFAGMEDCEVA